MFNKFSSRIILAWIALGLAMILLTLSVSFAQSVSIIRKDNSEVKFKYKSTDKKNSQDIDTTFIANNDDEFYSIMQDISDRHDLSLSMLKNHDLDQLDNDSKRSFSYNLNVSTDDKKSKKRSKNSKGDVADIHIEINRSMKELEKEMNELEASIANMKFEMHFDDEDSDTDEMDIRIHSNQPVTPQSPPAPPAPPAPGAPIPPTFDKKKECMQITIDKHGKQTRIFKNLDQEELNIPDSLDNEDHVIVFGDKGEKAPELEKVITNENGRKVFIYKRNK